MKPNGQPRLSAEMMATADSLRHVAGQVLDLVEARNPIVVNQPATAVVLVDGVRVAEALETLAGRLDITR